MNIRTPYLLCLGDATDPLSIKMAKSAADWSPHKCIGEYRETNCTVTAGLEQMSIKEGAASGAKSFVLGFANSGGFLEPKWVPAILEALEAGMDIVSGLHDKLDKYHEVKETAERLGRQLIDIRHPKDRFKTGTGLKRQGKRILTVGTDCSVGKMYTSLALVKAMKQKGLKANFRATGQCGILISGEGVAVDCVISDFIAGSVESLSPEMGMDEWDIIEGQGSLLHPAFAGVSMGLIHGAQPDALVVCHALNRSHMRGLPTRPMPELEEIISINELCAKTTNPNAKVIGISLNTSSVCEDEAVKACKELTDRFGLPCVDPIRNDLSPILDQLECL